MTTRLEAHAIREALFTSRLAAADTPEMFEQVYRRLPVPEQELPFQAAECLMRRADEKHVPFGMGSALELFSKIGMLLVEKGYP